MATYTFISACVGDQVPGFDLANVPEEFLSPERLERLLALPEVREFFRTNSFDWDHPDQCMYLVRGRRGYENFPVLSVKVPPRSAS